MPVTATKRRRNVRSDTPTTAAICTDDAPRSARVAAMISRTSGSLVVGSARGAGWWRHSRVTVASAAFGPAARTYAESVTNFAVTPTDIERPSSKTMEIKTHETYDSLADVNGDPVDAPFLVDEYWVYTLVLSDGSWVITDVVMLL